MLVPSCRHAVLEHQTSRCPQEADALFCDQLWCRYESGVPLTLHLVPAYSYRTNSRTDPRRTPTYRSRVGRSMSRQPFHLKR